MTKSSQLANPKKGALEVRLNSAATIHYVRKIHNANNYLYIYSKAT